MTTRRAIVVIGLFACSIVTVLAQLPTPTPALDRRGKPLPFGVQPYFLPEVPLGSGPYKAIMSQEPGLTEQVAYFPADLAALGAKKLPIVTWGNGSCMYAGNRFRQYLTEIASHGYLVIAGGPLADKELEVGPQENPAARQGGPGSAAPTPPAPDPANPPGRVTVPILTHAIDWALQQNADSGSRFHNRLDTRHVVAMGQSCGGGLAVQQAVEDTRVTALGVWNSGAGLGARSSAAAIPLDNLKGPVLVITGSEKLDIAFASGKSTFERINQASVFYGWRDDLQHIGTYGAANGGELGQIAWKWLEWTTRGDQTAAKMFKGAACGLCKDPAWHVMKKKIDGQDRGSANARIFEPGAAPR
jgi:dienelactone hydrolase